MYPDYKRFSQNREIFPRELQYDSNKLICGHLNRLKFPTDVETYLKNRKQGKTMTSSLAIANRCICRQQEIPKNPVKQQLNRIQMDFDQSKNLINALQNIKIVLPKESKQQKQVPKQKSNK